MTAALILVGASPNKIKKIWEIKRLVFVSWGWLLEDRLGVSSAGNSPRGSRFGLALLPRQRRLAQPTWMRRTDF